MSLEGHQIDRYRILRLLGSGGMGEVYLAEDPRIEQQVAIKVIRAEGGPYPDTQSSQEATRLFQREARAIAKLDHPHILPLNAYGEERLGNMMIIYLVMPYRREGSLADWLRQRGQSGLLAPAEVAYIVRQTASALQHAHDRQIVHQDVKPSNFLVRQRPEKPTRPDLLLADFGVARFSTATASASQTVRGTPTYMAPEQWAGQPVPASDQYALAVMAYELLTGRPPFQGAPGPLMYQHLTLSAPPPSTFNARLSRDIDTVLLHALAKKPEERFASVTAFATAFQQAVQAMPAAQTPTPLTAAPTSPATTDIHAVLAISPAEAQTGTTRTLTLPGGRQVTVQVPAGARDGQLVRLEGQGEASPAGGEAGALILTILVAAAPSLSTASAALAEATLLTAEPTALATSAPTVADTGQQPMVSTAARPELSTSTGLDLSATEAATSTSQGSLPPTEAALPTKPSIGRPGELREVAQAEQQTSSAPVEQPVQPPVPVTPQPAQRGISRRQVLVGLATLVVAGGGLTWWVVSRTSQSASFTYQGDGTAVYAVAWSPDGTRIASAGYNETVQVWNAADGSNPYTYRGRTGGYCSVDAVAWSPDGKRIASGSCDKTVQVWNAADGSNPYTYQGHSDSVTAVAWSPDGSRIASAGYDNTVQVWNAANGSHPYTYRGHTQLVDAVAWSPNGSRIASGSGDKTVQVWNAADGSNAYTYRGHSDWVRAVAWSPDGKRIASGGNDGTVQVWVAM
jgi:curved DNA-binding protein CbpA